MRPLAYIMTPVIILTIILAARFVTWDAIKGKDPQAEAALQAGTTALRNWKLSHAITAFTQAITREPTYAEAYIKRGLAYYRAGRYEAAITDYTRTLDLNRYRADAYASRGDAHRALGNTQQAIADYSDSLKNRWNAHALRHRAYIYLEQNAAQKALTDYAELIKRQPNATAYYARGNAYRRLSTDTTTETETEPEIEKGTLRLALTDLDQAIDLEQRFASAYICRAQVYERLGDTRAADADYRQASKFLSEALQTWQGDPNGRIPLHLWRAVAHQKLGETENAATDLRETYRGIRNFFLKSYAKL